MRSVDNLPEKQRQKCELMIDDGDAGIYGPDWLFRPRQELRVELPDIRHMINGAIVEDKVPSGVIASCGEEDKGGFCCVEE